MITIESLYDYNNFKILLDRHFTKEQMAIENNVIPLTDNIIYHIVMKNYNIVKTIFSITSNSIINSTKPEFTDEILNFDPIIVKQFKEQNNFAESTCDFDDGFYIYLGSRNAFASNFGFNVYSPSINQFIIAVFETINSIKFIGGGKGSFVIFKPVRNPDNYYENLSKNIFSGVVASRKDFFSNPKNSKYVIKVLEQDSDYYLNIIKQISEENMKLQDRIKNAEYQNYLSTQMTWR